MKIEFFIIFIFVGLFLVAGSVLAQQPVNINYPVQELGGCKNQADCKAFCDDPLNGDACMDFAKKQNLMSDAEIEVAKKFMDGKMNGPGGCISKEQCEEYCNDISKIDECVAFAEKNNLMPESELKDAKQVQAAMKNGIKPPACGNKKACDIYCENPEHMEECVSFAVKSGMINGKEAEDAQKMLEAVKRGVKPPPCKGKEECDDYCSKPENMEVCMNFAIEAGMMSQEEKEGAQKTLEAIKKGVNPPPCKGKEECDAYCQSEEHIEECINFSIAAGMMDAKDAEMAKKTKGKGPGGCKSKEECEAFCSKPGNEETCFNFQKDNGLLTDEQNKNISGMQNALQTAPSEVIDCLTNFLGADTIQKLKNGVSMNLKDKQAGMDDCFSKGGGKDGPCKSPEECCKLDPSKCPEQKTPPENEGASTGPGGCQSEAECEAYCSTHRQECGAPPEGTIMHQCEGAECNSWSAEDRASQQQQQVPQEQQPLNENPPPPVSHTIDTNLIIGSLLDAFYRTIILR